MNYWAALVGTIRVMRLKKKFTEGWFTINEKNGEAIFNDLTICDLMTFWSPKQNNLPFNYKFWFPRTVIYWLEETPK